MVACYKCHRFSIKWINKVFSRELLCVICSIATYKNYYILSVSRADRLHSRRSRIVWTHWYSYKCKKQALHVWIIVRHFHVGCILLSNFPWYAIFHIYHSYFISRRLHLHPIVSLLLLKLVFLKIVETNCLSDWHQTSLNSLSWTNCSSGCL